MKKLLYPACFYPCEDKPGAYTVVVPDLPGCFSVGDTFDEALASVVEAIDLHLEGITEEGADVARGSP